MAKADQVPLLGLPSVVLLDSSGRLHLVFKHVNSTFNFLNSAQFNSSMTFPDVGENRQEIHLM
jgi:hypothetical protein